MNFFFSFFFLIEFLKSKFGRLWIEIVFFLKLPLSLSLIFVSIIEFTNVFIPIIFLLVICKVLRILYLYVLLWNTSNFLLLIGLINDHSFLAQDKLLNINLWIVIKLYFSLFQSSSSISIIYVLSMINRSRFGII